MSLIRLVIILYQSSQRFLKYTEMYTYYVMKILMLAGILDLLIVLRVMRILEKDILILKVLLMLMILVITIYHLILLMLLLKLKVLQQLNIKIIQLIRQVRVRERTWIIKFLSPKVGRQPREAILEWFQLPVTGASVAILIALLNVTLQRKNKETYG